MPQTVFISHAGADFARAAQVAVALEVDAISVRLDRADLVLGDSFLSFMEEALATSDYCLLLWSRQAAAAQWVKVEWEAALYRSVHEKRAFLLAARLDDTALPALLQPRLRTDLFPDLQPGLSTLVRTWAADKAAAETAKRPVGEARACEVEPAGPDEIYVTSELFGIAVPWKVDLDRPAALLLAEVIARFTLPRQIEHEGRIGMGLTYRLMHAGQQLDPHVSLRRQGLEAAGVVWLETTVTPFAASATLQGQLAPTTFRGSSRLPPELLTAVRRAGLGIA